MTSQSPQQKPPTLADYYAGQRQAELAEQAKTREQAAPPASQEPTQAQELTVQQLAAQRRKIPSWSDVPWSGRGEKQP